MAEQVRELTAESDDHDATGRGLSPLAAAESRRLRGDGQPPATGSSTKNHDSHSDEEQKAAAAKQDSSGAGLQEDPA